MRTREKTSIGSVVAPGPETKLAMTRSSKESVNASSQPDITAGMIIGRVMIKNTFSGVAPRSIAASSMERSSSRSREEITTAT